MKPLAVIVATALALSVAVLEGGCDLACLPPCTGRCLYDEAKQVPADTVLAVGATLYLDTRLYFDRVNKQTCPGKRTPIPATEVRIADSTIVQVRGRSGRVIPLKDPVVGLTATAPGRSRVALVIYDTEWDSGRSYPIENAFTIDVR